MASASSLCPLPATPAIPTISAPPHVQRYLTQRCVPLAPRAVTCLRLKTTSPGVCAARSYWKSTSRPTIIRASSGRVTLP